MAPCMTLATAFFREYLGTRRLIGLSTAGARREAASAFPKPSHRFFVSEKDHHIEQAGSDGLARQSHACGIHEHAGFDPQFVREAPDGGLGRFMFELRKC